MGKSGTFNGTFTSSGFRDWNRRRLAHEHGQYGFSHVPHPTQGQATKTIGFLRFTFSSAFQQLSCL